MGDSTCDQEGCDDGYTFVFTSRIYDVCYGACGGACSLSGRDARVHVHAALQRAPVQFAVVHPRKCCVHV